MDDMRCSLNTVEGYDGLSGGLMLRVDGKMMLAFPCGTSRLLLYQRIFFLSNSASDLLNARNFSEGRHSNLSFFFLSLFLFFSFYPIDPSYGPTVLRMKFDFELLIRDIRM